MLGSRISSSHFHLFFFVPSLCIVCRDVNRCALLVLRPSWKHFRAVCFPFETQSGSLLLLLQIPQVEYQTVEGTAKAGKDFKPAEGQLTFAENESEKSFDVGIIDDDQQGRDTEFSVVLKSPISTVRAKDGINRWLITQNC